VAVASGMSRNTVIKAEREVLSEIEPSASQRAVGGGDRLSEVKQLGLLEALEGLVNPETRGNPMSLLRWTSRSTAKLADELVRQGFKFTDDTVGRILKGLSYSLQALAKEKEGASHPDHDAQFGYLKDEVTAFVEANELVISVDTKKKVRHEVAPSSWRLHPRHVRGRVDRRRGRGARHRRGTLGPEHSGAQDPPTRPGSSLPQHPKSPPLSQARSDWASPAKPDSCYAAS